MVERSGLVEEYLEREPPPNWSCKADLDRGSRAGTTVSNGLVQRIAWAKVVCDYRPADYGLCSNPGFDIEYTTVNMPEQRDSVYGANTKGGARLQGC